MKKIALTGNMGSGKSYVASYIERYGVFVLDIDEVAREIRKKHMQEILLMFTIHDEKQLGGIIFNDENKRKQLEAYLYPLMLQQMSAFFELHHNETMVIVEVPLLFEKAWQIYFDEVWCVTCTLEVALQRLRESRNISEAEAMKRLVLQMNCKEKEEKSDQLIYNNIGDNINKQIKELLKMEGIYVEEG